MLRVDAGAGSEYRINMANVLEWRNLECTGYVTTADGAGRRRLAEVLEFGPYTARVRAAPPSCDGVPMAVRALRAKADNCFGSARRQRGKYETVAVQAFTDPQLHDVDIEVTSVMTNQLTANCNRCTAAQRRRERRGKKRPKDPPCTCLPGAVVNEGAGSIAVLADVASGRGAHGRVYRVGFTATSPTGLSCAGVAQLCVGGRELSDRQNPGGGNVIDEQQGAAARAKAPACSAVRRTYGAAAKGPVIGEQCAVAPQTVPARMTCTAAAKDQWYNALEATCVKAGRRRDLKKAAAAAKAQAAKAAKAKATKAKAAKAG